MSIINCLLCKAQLKSEPARVPATNPYFTITYFDCPCCGEFGIQAKDMDTCMRELTEVQRAAVAAFACERSLENKKAVILWNNLSMPVNIQGEVWILCSLLIKDFPLPPITERFDRALLNLSKIGGPAKKITIQKTNIGLFYAENNDVLFFIYNALAERGYLRLESVTHDVYGVCEITDQGWVHIEEINRGRLGKNNHQAFVAMWFDSKMDPIYSEGIHPAIKEAGFEPLRIKEKESNNQVTDEIIAEIRRSKFMVADLTGKRHAVHYEAGFMHGLGRPVIFTCKQDDLDETLKANFDTNHYPYISYENPEDLKKKLLNRIRATIID